MQLSRFRRLGWIVSSSQQSSSSSRIRRFSFTTRRGMMKVNISIDVPDLDQGLKFYEAAFGWKETCRPMPTMAVVDGGNVSVCIHAKAAGSHPTMNKGDTTRTYERHWTPVHLDLHVDDFDRTLKQAQEAGAVVEMSFSEPMATAFCSDPFGHGFCLIGSMKKKEG